MAREGFSWLGEGVNLPVPMQKSTARFAAYVCLSRRVTLIPSEKGITGGSVVGDIAQDTVVRLQGVRSWRFRSKRRQSRVQL